MFAGKCLANKMIPRIIVPPSTIRLVRCKSKPHHGTRYDENAFMRTNVIGDFISRFTNDINMVSIGEDDDTDNQCKYIAYINCVIIIGLLLYMFIDNNLKKNKDD
jgi:hypothetical protein